MNKLSNLFNNLIDARNKSKKATLKYKDGGLSKGELFDIEFFEFELQEKFIKEIKKIK